MALAYNDTKPRHKSALPGVFLRSNPRQRGLMAGLGRRNAMSKMSVMIEPYLAGPKQLRQACAGMTGEQALARPIAGKWSTLEVVCHLADFEPIMADRMKRTIAEERPTLMGADESDFVKALQYHERDLNE